MTDLDLDPIRIELAKLGRPHTPLDVADVLRRRGQAVTDDALRSTVAALRRESVGAGPLEPLLRLPGVTDVCVNGPDEVYVDTGMGLRRTDVRFADEAEVRALAQRLAAGSGRRLDAAVPFADARLADGTRVHAILATLTEPGTCLSLRIPARRRIALTDWADGPDHTVVEVLTHLIRSRLAFLVTGGTGSGKTTLLAALLGTIPAQERIVIVEDSRELRPDHPHVVSMEGRPANAENAGAISLTLLVRQALRMRPDRLVVGEVRGAELCDLLTALNTGHEGGCGTVHANSPADVPARLEALAALGGMDRLALHAQLGAALHAVVHVHRGSGGRRRITEIAVLARAESSGLVRVESALRFPPGERACRGPGADRLEQLLGGAA